MSAEVGASWESPARKRVELTAVIVFVVVCLVMPLIVSDLCPFTRAPMFADAPTQYCDYTICDPEGHALKPLNFGLQRNYWGNPPGEGVGHRPPEGVDVFGQVADRATVEAMVQRRLARSTDLSYVEVTQQVIGAIDDRQVGVVRETKWRIDNPAFRPPTKEQRPTK
jgi:hypothetical protein